MYLLILKFQKFIDVRYIGIRLDFKYTYEYTRDLNMPREINRAELVYIQGTKDGRGIDMDSLPQRARGKPNIDRQAVSRFEQSGELWRILLLPGFTTATLVSRYSGYGVGLDSLNQFVLSKSGDLVIESLLGEGTTVRIKLPLTPTEGAGHVS